MTLASVRVRTALLAACALSLSACASWQAAEPAKACYWMTQDGSRWVAFTGVQTRQDCFALDSCAGGLGQSGGGCYKWASGPDAPAEAW